MNQSPITFSTELKTKIVLEVLHGKPSVIDIATKYRTTVENILMWKQQFLANATQIFETQRSMQALERRIKKYVKENKKLTFMAEKVTTERDLVCRTLQSLSIAHNRRLMNSRSHTLEIRKQREVIALDYLLIS
jgi:transposase-like protein